MVRDDFPTALHRFMESIGFRIDSEPELRLRRSVRSPARSQGAGGIRAGLRSLAVRPQDDDRGQNEFLDRAIDGLSQEGRVISVRLSLFAEMVKGKPWTPETLKQIGGAEGVGVTFLEETFSARSAPPSHRIHQKAAQAVLKALLPEIGSDIKGHMRSHRELLEASGYGSRPNEFDDLLRILDGELRLITPTDPEGRTTADQEPAEPESVITN